MKLDKKHIFAFGIILLICLLYLYKYFLGFVDIPIDLRDLKMYPWKYHAVDKHVKSSILWKSDFITGDSYVFSIEPNQTSSIVLDINIDKVTNTGSIKNTNNYINFVFKTVGQKLVPYGLGLTLIDKKTQDVHNPKVSIASVSSKVGVDEWYKAQFSLNDLFAKSQSLGNLNNYAVKITAQNKSTSDTTVLKIKDLKLESHDYSKVPAIKNHYLIDIIQMFPPIRGYFSDSLKERKLPFWNNYILTGTEFLSEPQVGFFHPLYFLSYLFFNQFTAHALVSLVCLFLCGIGAYLLCSYWQLGFVPSLIAGIVYMFHPFNVTHFSYEHILLCSSSIPFLILCFEKCVKNNRFLNIYLLLSSLLLGILFISGHLQVVYYAVMLFFLFVLFRTITRALTEKRIPYKEVLSGVFVFLFGLMISSIVLVPFLPLFQNSHRVANPEGFIKTASVPISALIGWIYPFYKGIPDWPMAGFTTVDPAYDAYRIGFSRNYVYFGIIPFLFTLFSFKELIKKNKLLIFFLTCILFSFLVCMGSFVFYLIKDIIPGFKEMQHYRFIMLYSFCIPFVVGIGCHALFNSLVHLRKKTLYVIGIIVVLITAVDLMCYSSFFMTWSKKTDYKPIHRNGAIGFLINKKNNLSEPFRILSFIGKDASGSLLQGDIAKPNTLLPYGLEDVSGYSSFIPEDLYYSLFYVQTQDKDKLYSGKIFGLFDNVNVPYPISNYHSKILDLFNVKYFMVPNHLNLNTKDVKKVFDGDATVYENLNCLPRAFIVPNYEIIENPRDIIVKLNSEEFKPQEVVVLMNKPVIAREQSDRSNPDRSLQLRSGLLRQDFVLPRNDIDFLNYEPENIKLKVQTDSAGFLVLGHNLNSNWHVKINGKKDMHFQANLVQRAVYLPRKGEYEVEFYYFSKRYLFAAIVTISALLILFLLGCYLQFKQAIHKS